MNKKISLYSGFIAVFILGLFCGVVLSQQRQSVDTPLPQGGVEQTLNQYQLMIDYGDDTMVTANDIGFTQGDTIFAAMQSELNKKNVPFEFKQYSGLGTLVTKIGSKENGGGKRYWQYWVNGKHPDIGADQQLLKPGDVVEWKFTSFQGS